MEVVTVGDALVCMNPLTKGPLQYVHQFEKKVGGAELNVAIGCARLGIKTGWISCLGNDPFGQFALTFARGQGIDVETIKLVNGSPTSVYFKEVLNPNTINSYYYRENSPTEQLEVTDQLLNYIGGAKIFHFSGVFPSVCEKNRLTIKALLEEARARNVRVSFDANIRLKLWSKEEARETIHSYLPYIDVLLLGEEEAQLLFDTDDIESLKEILKPFTISDIVLKKGSKGAVAYRLGEKVERQPIENIQVIDVIGAGDGFAAGYIYSLLQNLSLKDSLDFANAVAIHVITIPGDNEGLPNLEQVEMLLGKRNHIAR